jgi:hypothetical protein
MKLPEMQLLSMGLLLEMKINNLGGACLLRLHNGWKGSIQG